MTKASEAPIPILPAPGGTPLPHCRDRELLVYVGRHGIVAMPHVMAALKIGQTAAYRRVAACIEAGLLERIDHLRGEPNLLRTTRAGLRYVGLGLAPATVSPGAVDHWLRCATTARLLGECFGHERISTERELRFLERLEGRPVASARLGELPSGHARLHRPDLVIVPAGHPLHRLHVGGDGPVRPSAPDGNQTRVTGKDDEAFSFARYPNTGDAGSGPTVNPRTREGEREIAGCDERALPGAEEIRADAAGMRSVPAGLIAVEVELTPKAPRRLLQIIRAWRGADCVASVRYLCAPGPTRRGVELAVAKTYAGEKVQVDEVVAR